VEATDDPSDYDEGTTDDPVKAIARFVGKDIPGGEFFEKMMATPTGVAAVLRRLASQVESRSMGPRVLKRVLKRMYMFPASLSAALRPPSRSARTENVADREVDNLIQEMRKKGWRATKTESRKTGLPMVKLDLDYFEATIEVDSINYEIQYMYEGRRDLAKEQVTDDPIREFRSWYKSKEFEEAEDERRAEVEAARSKDFAERATEPVNEERKPAHYEKTTTVPAPLM
jgi:hypothetical protein